MFVLRFSVCLFPSDFSRQLIISKASAYGDEVWQEDSFSKAADRMFIALRTLEGFSYGGTSYLKFAFHTFPAFLANQDYPKRMRIDRRRLGHFFNIHRK